MLNTTHSHYRIVKHLGGGGMGVVKGPSLSIDDLLRDHPRFQALLEENDPGE